jgi:AraC family transcriptional activator of pobA
MVDAPLRAEGGVRADMTEMNFATRRAVADYASALCLSPNYLNETVKTVLGAPTSYHIQQRIMLEAKRLAVYSNYTMKQVAYHLGFDDLAHFSKFFKNASGECFSEFRRKSLSDVFV